MKKSYKPDRMESESDRKERKSLEKRAKTYKQPKAGLRFKSARTLAIENFKEGRDSQLGPAGRDISAKNKMNQLFKEDEKEFDRENFLEEIRSAAFNRKPSANK